MIITANAVFWIAFLIMVLWVMVAIAEADNDFVTEVEVFVSEVEAGDVVTFTNYFGEIVTGEVIEVNGDNATVRLTVLTDCEEDMAEMGFLHNEKITVLR